VKKKTFIIVVVLVVCAILVGFLTGIIPTSIPQFTSTQANPSVAPIAKLTVTPGSAGAGQLETAIPTKTIIVNIADAEKMRQLLHQKMVAEITNWLIVARLTTGGGAHACFVAWI